MTEACSKATAGAEGGEAGSSELGHSPCGPKRSFSTTGLTVPEKPAPQEFERKPRALGIGREWHRTSWNLNQPRRSGKLKLSRKVGEEIKIRITQREAGKDGLESFKYSQSTHWGMQAKLCSAGKLPEDRAQGEPGLLAFSYDTSI